MSIWIRIANCAAKVSIESYAGWKIHLSPFGVIVELGCFNVALFWNMAAVSAASSARTPQS